ncbi:PDR/VanB family oxidoreductase [Methylibium rhizosphaerae]|jgi:vanillate O-demethylase ferredoxin subunit|uniref:PDR/VanB family oxidoreductase n=1 Tax=Methylibium rhizosphaerae TaxID=2570323 RepID=UPI00112BE422|nr:PDR/VanB family oxidoreductase [Methylibium rhizosphaerae]
MDELELIVSRRRQEAEGICSFELARPDGGELPPFTAGAHIDVYVQPGVVRQYSLCGEPGDRRRWRIAVLREPASRGGSAGMHDEVKPGSTLRVSTPRNHFALVPAPHSLLLAGGIGVTPILAMAKTLHREGGSFEMHYCTRSPGRTAFLDELRAAAFGQRARFHFDDGLPAQKFDADSVLSGAQPGTHLYVCGPSGFMDHVLGTARRLGWAEERLHREYFAGSVVSSPADTGFDIQLARSKRTLQIPADKSVLQVLLDGGIDVAFSCESGVCGSCLTPVLEGTPDHRDSYLTDAERAANDQFTPCCSRSKTPVLILDL